MNDLILALDFGGTKLSAAVVEQAILAEPNPAWTAHGRRFTPDGISAAEELVIMFELALELLDGHHPSVAGVSFGGPVDFANGIVRLSHHVSGWEDTPLKGIIAEAFEAPAIVDNDGNVAALGEHHFGAGRDVESLLYITVSTGVGGGWILNGRPWRGNESMAGEIGHTVVDAAGPLCLCGKRGCVERLASGPYMARDAAALLESDPAAGPLLRQLMEQQPLTGKLVAEAAALGDKLARDILLRGARALGAGIGNAANLMNPQRFILGGGVTRAGEAWWTAVRESARAMALPEVSFDIVPAALGDDAPLWGAAVLAQQHAE